MDRFTNLHHTTESKRQVRNTTTNLHIRTYFFDCLHSIDKVNTVVRVLFHTSTNSQHIRIEHNVFRWETNFVHQNIVRTLANTDFFRFCCSLTFFVKGHHYYSSTVLSQQSRVFLEEFFTDLQGNRIHNRFTLTPFQTCHHNVKLGSIQHKGHLRHLRFRHSNLDKLLHRSKSIQHTIINIDINHMGTIFHLLFRNVHSSTIVTLHH
mmetsp:Transcript_26852/g.37750  ORF Transcript_26852/g.37750 Transcript_26852/m.37750 type:complete len:207 (-) Transcript_26852:40-660(-)